MLRHVDWPQAWRIIASRYPPIQVFERLTTDARVWDALIELEQRTNPRVRDEIGNIALVSPQDRITGAGASYVMASFTHLNPKGSRFSDGSYGVYYAASDLDTAIAETAFHFEQFARDSDDPARTEDMRVLVGSIQNDFEDVSALPVAERNLILEPASYAAAQVYGRRLREQDSLGVTYPSVRHAGGKCVGAFKARAVGLPHQERHLKYYWDGKRLSKYFDYAKDCWVELVTRATST
jgi:hypothetical protein